MTISPSKKLCLSKKEEKELIIILAAEEVFRKYGYHKTTVREIGDSVGLNKASLYHYFKNKEDLFLGVILHQFSMYKKKMEEIPSDLPINEQIYLFFYNHTTFIMNNPNYRHALDLDLKALSPQTKAKIIQTRETQFKLLEEIINTSIEKGEMKKIDSSLLALTLKFLFAGVKKAISSYSLLYDQDLEQDFLWEKAKASISMILSGLLSESRSDLKILQTKTE